MYTIKWFGVLPMSNKDYKIVVKHYCREVNLCVDALDNFRCTLTGEIIFYDTCPAQFSHLLTTDLIKFSIPRLIHV